ncbi:L,D-transpeptidase [Microvirga guangxiensis]|uniref:Lipoprotein-anchoring transpeptidase ErfK/SrfK n=1 Tax=Microvirga guangxiensis TaxID=549386 RepID=A0A1G5IPE8_9HYPH|nr:L,D-transpeptidase [Microvirga guangxiensis]SCY77621.1 Lipoprotein-anchoring transpeptidase ErfK/SrfK [Microvirga guangxiensis]
MDLNRRAFVLGLPAAAICSSLPVGPSLAQQAVSRSTYQAMYAPIEDDLYPIPGVDLSRIDPNYLRKVVPYQTSEEPGTIVVDPRNRYLYLVLRDGMAVRYGVGVGRSGFSWSGSAVIKDKQEWPDWYPPKEMFERQPELMEQMGELPGGPGMAGGPGNPLGARAMYLWQGNKDTLYRIHGTFEPWTIGTNVSSGCIRMINQDAIDLYNHTSLGAKVVVLGSSGTKKGQHSARAS